jgi:hypothetical protein
LKHVNAFSSRVGLRLPPVPSIACLTCHRCVPDCNSATPTCELGKHLSGHRKAEGYSRIVCREVSFKARGDLHRSLGWGWLHRSGIGVSHNQLSPPPSQLLSTQVDRIQQSLLQMLTDFFQSSDPPTPETVSKLASLHLFDIRADPYVQCRGLFLAPGSTKKRKLLESSGYAFETRQHLSSPGSSCE